MPLLENSDINNMLNKTKGASMVFGGEQKPEDMLGRANNFVDSLNKLIDKFKTLKGHAPQTEAQTPVQPLKPINQDNMPKPNLQGSPAPEQKQQKVVVDETKLQAGVQQLLEFAEPSKKKKIENLLQEYKKDKEKYLRIVRGLILGVVRLDDT